MQLSIPASIQRVCAGTALALTLGLGAISSASAQNFDVGFGNRRTVADQWTRLVERFSSASPDANEYNSFAEKSFQLHLRFGENPEGVIVDPGSTSNFYSADYFPRMMSAYCYWKSASLKYTGAKGETSAANYDKAAETLQAVIDLPRFERYQFPCIQAIYIDSALRSSIGDPDILTHLKQLKTSLKRFQHWKPDAPLYVVHDKLSPEDIKIQPDLELAALTYGGRGVPFVLAHRLMLAERAALMDIIQILHQKPVFDIVNATEGKITATEESPIPVIAGKVYYEEDVAQSPLEEEARKAPRHPFFLPLELEAIETGPGGGRSLGTIAPNALGSFRIPLDRRLPGGKAKVVIKWKPTDAEKELGTFLPLLQLQGQDVPENAKEVYFAYTSKFTAENAFSYVNSKKDLLTYQTDLAADTTFTQGLSRPETDRITVTSANARYIRWKAVDAGGVSYPLNKDDKEDKQDRAAIVQEFENGSVQLDLNKLKPENLPMGEYRLRISLTEQNSANPASWTPGAYYGLDAAQKAPPEFMVSSQSVAFLVGIDAYGTQSLYNCANDAWEMEQKLTQKFGYARSNVTYLLGRRFGPDGRPYDNIDSSEGPANGVLTIDRFHRSLYRFLQTVKQRHANHILLFFSGHGASMDGSDYFIFGDGKRIQTRVILQDLATILDGTPGPPPVIIGMYDACRNGDDKKNQFQGEAFASAGSSLNYFPILSCAPGQQSNDNGPTQGPGLEDASGKHIAHGFFTYSILKGMDAYLASSQDRPLEVEQLLVTAIPVMNDLMAKANDVNKKYMRSVAPNTGKLMTPFTEGQTISTNDPLLYDPNAVVGTAKGKSPTIKLAKVEDVKVLGGSRHLPVVPRNPGLGKPGHSRAKR